jgi:hypothetical protein
MKKVLISLLEGICNVFDELKGELGSNSEVVRTMVISFLSEKAHAEDLTENAGQPAPFLVSFAKPPGADYGGCDCQFSPLADLLEAS